GCKGKYEECTRDSDCCDEKNRSGRKLRCLTQCDEGGCLKYRQCLFYGGLQ
uniref:Kappa-actitoxin-Bcs4a n=1 Tax=Bunodosoma caissarum TaxID=31165 RepID=KV53_BUNCI|nr:RecName: Full=Kappa-actitoxin-Bcs4a; Short=Kappa-AITX-Bcs4a; AltName: Full=Potassium channel toxin BcsTx3 [Bunodosoma caissarum]